MNFRSVKLSSGSKSLLLMTLAIIFLIAGCKVKDITWIDNMLSEMETAWIEVDKAGGGQDGRDKAVSLVAKKYFRQGMPMAEDFELLSQLKSHEFSIYEEHQEGTRIWPNGELRPFKDEKIMQGKSIFTVRKDQYGRTRLIISKGISMSLTVDANNAIAINAEARIWASSI